MIEHHRRVIGKPGVYQKGQRLSITRGPVTGFVLRNDELKEGEHFEINSKQGVITFLKHIKVKESLRAKFDFSPQPPTEEEKRREKLIREKIREIAIRELEEEGKL